jgi:3-hydroxyacyl-CoA dehydrogenase/enoyl-CoA hydratase/3-hydroxybutyryl-CoA epimerase
MMKNNQLGRKSGQGFYQWHDGKVVKNDENNNKQSDLHVNLQDRLILPMLNEAVACLHEGVVDDADMLDVGVILGTGFAPFRGGPLNYAKNRGTTDIQRILTELAAKYGDRFLPHEGWSNLDAK